MLRRRETLVANIDTTGETIQKIDIAICSFLDDRARLARMGKREPLSEEAAQYQLLLEQATGIVGKE